ncbi:MAG TPA: alpha/beta fold hydrolase [Sphingomicrobium sp.]|nr:alpha/beta fold hydrolase [Sphingomicrobium sp.]
MFAQLIAAALLANTAAATKADSPTVAWEAPPTTLISIEEKVVERDGIRLAGTLRLPVGEKDVPAVVVFHTASAPERDAALYDHLEQLLPSLGIAVFTFDRRGTGASSGDAKGNAFDVLADDGIAAAQMLALDPRIDSRRIGFWGLSQGGWLSILAASRYKPTAFAISISAPMVTPDVQMIFASENILRIKGYSQADIDQAVAARKGLDDFMRGRLDRPSAQARIDAAAKEPWFDLIYLSRTFSDPDKSGWAKEIRHDPLASIGNVTAPTLVLYGSADPWVPVATSMNRLQGFTRAHPNFEAVVIDNADHTMMSSATPLEQIDPGQFTKHAPDSPEYFARLAAWLQRKGISRLAN